MKDPRKHLWLAIILPIILILACKIEPVPISFGEDQCYACKMMISDQRFGGELVTQKGKIYKFDAMECLIDYLNEHDESTFKHILTIDFLSPGKLIDAKKAHYLINAEIPSPMGANLSVYSDPVEANKRRNTNNATLFNWPEIKNELSR